jgi:hypothetical protein
MEMLVNHYIQAKYMKGRIVSSAMHRNTIIKENTGTATTVGKPQNSKLLS